VLDFLSTTDVGRKVPNSAAEEEAQSEASEWELREPREREVERRVQAEELGAWGWGTTAVSPHASFRSVRGRGVGAEKVFGVFLLFLFLFPFLYFLLFFLCDFLGALLYHLVTGLGGW
jgi:hypothetical protein